MPIMIKDPDALAKELRQTVAQVADAYEIVADLNKAQYIGRGSGLSKLKDELKDKSLFFDKDGMRFQISSPGKGQSYPYRYDTMQDDLSMLKGALASMGEEIAWLINFLENPETNADHITETPVE